MKNKNFDINTATREEWRELGFYYEQDAVKQLWIFKGSKEGLLKFADLLDKYANNLKHNQIYEHDHYGPYWYLKIMTWHKAVIDEKVITGRLEDFSHLAYLIRTKIVDVSIGEKFTIKDEFSPTSDYSLQFELQEHDFDPSSADSSLK